MENTVFSFQKEKMMIDENLIILAPPFLTEERQPLTSTIPVYHFTKGTLRLPFIDGDQRVSTNEVVTRK